MNKLDKIYLQLFSETDAIVEVAIKAGENAADIDNLEEKHEEIENQVEVIKQNQKWNDSAIDGLYDRLYRLENKVDEMEIKEEIEEENNPGIHEKETEKEGDTIIEEVEEKIEPDNKGNHWGTIIGTILFGGIVVFLIKLFESRQAGDKEV